MAVKEREKISTYFFEISDNHKLEEAAKHLQLTQLKEILQDIYAHRSHQQNKLLPILVGIPHELFCRLLTDLSSQELELLRDICTTEPLQHHLTLLVHELSDHTKNAEKAYVSLYDDISILDIAEHNQDDIYLKNETIDLLKKKFLEISSSAGQALNLAWSSNRLDLIESLSIFKEKAELCIENALGIRQTNDIPATGLYALLKKKQFAIYDKSGAIEGLKDHEPAIEALTVFGLWYASDYRSIGLLPDTKSEKTISRDSYQEAAENLARCGLKTIQDLKKADIFSGKTLKAYLTTHLDP